MKIFGRKESQEETNETGPRRYFEVFGDAVKENIFLRNVIILLVGLAIFQNILVMRVMNKPPLVIRVDQLGEAQAFLAIKSTTRITAPEVRNFANYFMKYLTAWDLYTFDDDFDQALAMTTESYKPKLYTMLQNTHAEEQIKANQLKTKLQITEMTIEKDTPEIVRVAVRGSRLKTSYEAKEFTKEEIFEDSITMKKVERTTKTPWGLLVDDWSEKIYK